MKNRSVLKGTQVVRARYFVMLFLALVMLVGCTSAAPQTEKSSVTQTTVVSTQRPASPSTGGPAPQNCPRSAPLETKTFPSGWGGNSGPMTLIGKGLAWGQLQPNEIYHFRQTGNGLKIIWAVGPLFQHESVEVSILNLATGKPIPAALNTIHGLDPVGEKITMSPDQIDFFYHPEPGWYVWGSIFQFPAPGCYQMDVKWHGGQWSANFPVGD